MTEACRSWASLSDREALGDWLAPQELEFLARHGRECASCRAEAELFSALGGVLDEPESLTRPVSRREGRRARVLDWGRELWSRHRPAFLTLSGVTAVAAGLALWLTSRGERSTVPPSAPPPPVELRARIGFVSGEVFVNGQRLVAGRELAVGERLRSHEGHACLTVPTGVTVCAGPDTELVVQRLGALERRLRLESGHVVARLERQQASASFGVETRAGSAVAKGTLFAVEASGEDVWVRVHEGTVATQSGAVQQVVPAPRSVLLAPGAPVGALSTDQGVQDLRMIRLTKVVTVAGSSRLEVKTSPAGAFVTIDELLLGTTPLTALLEPGAYRVGVEQAGFAPISEPVALREGERLLRSYELLSSAESPKAASEPGRAPASPPQSAAALLAEARQHRQSGRFTDARSTYQRLLKRYPESAEARAALVSLGELQLSRLDDARGALSSFDTYLRGGGALAQEARFGRIRALRQLGRHAEERAAIQSYLADYPRSLQAAALRARLAE